MVREDLAIRVWNDMGSQIDWTALEVMVERHGVDDVDLLITHLIAIREHDARQRDANVGL